MSANVGTIDRILRFIVGAILIALPFVTNWAIFANPIYYWASIIVGAVMILTALIKFCPAYTIFGLRT